MSVLNLLFWGGCLVNCISHACPFSIYDVTFVLVNHENTPFKQPFDEAFIPFYFIDALYRSVTAVQQKANQNQALKQDEVYTCCQLVISFSLNEICEQWCKTVTSPKPVYLEPRFK